MPVRMAAALVLAATAAPAIAAQPAQPLVVFNAGSLALPFKTLLDAFQRAHPGVQPMQESSGSLEAARKLTELGKIPDVLAVADYGVIAKVVMPAHASWYATFATNAMVLAYTERSVGAAEVNGDTWWRILTRPGVRWGNSDPALDPNGYRALMVFQLAETFYREPGLAQRLRAATNVRYVRPNEAQLTGLLQAGELDYAWSYQTLARAAGLKWVSLPSAIDLSDATQAAGYAAAVVRLPVPKGGVVDTVTFRGEPIAYALTIPAKAPHPATARAFVRFVLGPEGKKILADAGFRLPAAPGLVGIDRIPE